MRLRPQRFGRRLLSLAERDSVTGQRELDFLAGLVDPPLDGGERDLQRVGDLRVGQTDDVAQEQRHLQVHVHRLDRTPHGIHRLDLLDRCVDDLEEVGLVIEDDRQAWPALDRTQLVEHPVLRDLEEPRRESAPQRELRQALVHAQEDLLRQVLREGAIADEAHHVVEDRLLVRADDERERTLVSALGFPQYSEVRLLECQVGEV